MTDLLTAEEFFAMIRPEFSLCSIHKPGNHWHRTCVYYRRPAKSIFAGTYLEVMSKLAVLCRMSELASEDLE